MTSFDWKTTIEEGLIFTVSARMSVRIFLEVDSVFLFGE